MYYEGSRDFWTQFLGLVFRPEAEVLAEIKSVKMPRYMPIFEQVSTICFTLFTIFIF